MQRNRKAAILIILMTLAVFAWATKGTKTKGISLITPAVTFDQATPETRAMPSKRSELVDWGRDPFTFAQREEVGSVSNLEVLCIVLSDKETRAFVNESIVRVGDNIADKTVKRIEHDSVILTDGTEDYVLTLHE